MDILTALILLRDKAVNGELLDNDDGICDVLSAIMWSELDLSTWNSMKRFRSFRVDIIDFVCENVKTWAIWNGENEVYPIDSMISDHDYENYGKWELRALEARISLIDHLIEVLEDGSVVYFENNLITYLEE